MHRAYSILEIKSVDDEQRIIEGVATTPTPDRAEDVVDPMGGVFTLPIPFMWQHGKDPFVGPTPVGHVIAARPTPEGIPVRIRMEQSDQPGRLKDILDFAWETVKKRLVRGLSLGFKPIGNPEPIKGTFGLRFPKWSWLELSGVTLPQNAEANITLIKSIDTEFRAAHGLADTASSVVKPAPAAGPVKRLTTQPARGTVNIKDEIKGWEATRASKAAAMQKLMADASEKGETLDEAQSEEYEGLEGEVEAADKHIARLRKMEKSNIAAAVPVNGETVTKAADTRAGRIVRVEHALPKGTAFTRYAMAIAAGKGSVSDALRHAERWKESTPEVYDFIQKRDYLRKAEPGTTTDDVYGWAGPLVYPTNLVSEFVDLLRPATIVGRLTGIRNIPFNVRVPVQTGGSNQNWVGEAAPKPVSDLTFDVISLGYHKVAGIVVLTDELVKLSSPSAEDAVRRDLVEQTVRFIDAQFVDPSVSGSANNPASITNNVSATSATGTDADSLYADINTALATFDDTDMGTGSMYILMRPGLARAISALRNQLGNFEFPSLTPAGGTLAGFPVITSNSVPSGLVIFVKADEIFLADDGNVTLDASREATLDMNGGDSPTFNLFQRNCVAIRAERGITWTKRRPDAVAVIDNAEYGPVSGS